jgi:hypothetical protein
MSRLSDNNGIEQPSSAATVAAKRNQFKSPATVAAAQSKSLATVAFALQFNFIQ